MSTVSYYLLGTIGFLSPSTQSLENSSHHLVYWRISAHTPFVPLSSGTEINTPYQLFVFSLIFILVNYLREKKYRKINSAIEKIECKRAFDKVLD